MIKRENRRQGTIIVLKRKIKAIKITLNNL